LSQREIVEVENVTKDVRPGFGLRTKRVLHDITFSVREGEIFGFVGPNGAGKTTTLKVLMGLIRATSGEARVLGHDVSETAFRRHVGFLPENPYFYDYLTGRETLHFYARLCGMARGAARDERVETLLERVGLSHAADARLRTYSKGMQQRVGIAQALVHDPDVVFLDEPMSGLDPIGRKEIRDLILRLREQGKTVFMNTHILHDVELVCDRVAIIVSGRIRYEGSIEEFEEAERLSDVTVMGLPAETGALLEERFEAKLRPLGESIEVRVLEKQTDDVLRALLETGAQVVSVAPHRASLERIFMSAVEEGGR
jgi:ABC-2 type transport system ATP-binding protein